MQLKTLIVVHMEMMWVTMLTLKYTFSTTGWAKASNTKCPGVIREGSQTFSECLWGWSSIGQSNNHSLQVDHVVMIRQLRNAVYSRLSLIWLSKLRLNMTLWVWFGRLHLNREQMIHYLRDITAKLDSRQDRKLAAVIFWNAATSLLRQTALSQG